MKRSIKASPNIKACFLFILNEKPCGKPQGINSHITNTTTVTLWQATGNPQVKILKAKSNKYYSDFGNLDFCGGAPFASLRLITKKALLKLFTPNKKSKQPANKKILLQEIKYSPKDKLLKSIM